MSRADRNSNGFGCKFGNNCTKFNPNNIDDASRLRRILVNLTDRELFSWELIPELFRLFKLEHNKIARISNYNQLTNEWKKHFKDYVIIRTSCNNGSLYKDAYDYYNTLNLQKNKIANYDNIKIDDNTFYYNYENKENFIEEDNSEPIKSYLSKMYADEVKNNLSAVRKVSNRDNVIDDDGAGTTTKSKYIVMRAKSSYEPVAFTFNEAQFENVTKRIRDGSLTSTCTTKDTKITATEPKANTNYLMNTTFDNKCKCGKYHINTEAHKLWNSAAAGSKPRYSVDGEWIKYRYTAEEEADNQRHFLASDSSGTKLNGQNTGKQPSGGVPNGSTPETQTGDVPNGSTPETQTGDVTTQISNSSASGAGPGMYGMPSSDGGKDLAVFVNAGGSSAIDTNINNGSNQIDDSTNADIVDGGIPTGENGTVSATVEPTIGLVGNYDNNSNAPGSAAVSQGNNVNNQNQNSTIPNAAAVSQNNGGGGGGGTSSASSHTTKTLTLADVDNAAGKNGKTIYGDDIGSLPKIEILPGFSEAGHKPPIFGVPLMYNPVCDPNGRIYAETTMMDLPIIYIEPGRGKLNNTVDDQETMEALQDAYKDPSGGGIQTARTSEDLRALSFENAFSEFMEYFQNICSIVYGNMGLGIFDWKDGVSSSGGALDTVKRLFLDRSLLFFADTATSVSDAFSNEFSDAPLTSSINNFGVLVRNLKMMTIQNAVDVAKDDLGDGIVGNFQSKGDTGKNRSNLVSILNDIVSKGATIFNGSQLLFPQVWNDSRHDRSYSLSFKFFSPYGNKEAIFQKVYLPVLALITLTLPRMDGISGYAQPFYVRTNAPGYSD